MIDETQLISVSHAAKILGVSKPRICALIRAGKFNIVHIDHHKFLYEHEVKARKAMNVKPGRPEKG